MPKLPLQRPWQIETFRHLNPSSRRKQSFFWAPLSDGENAPFSWHPETVVVLESGNLALSTPPMTSEPGKVYSYYASIWCREEPGVWRVIFDKGNRISEWDPQTGS